MNTETPRPTTAEYIAAGDAYRVYVDAMHDFWTSPDDWTPFELSGEDFGMLRAAFREARWEGYDRHLENVSDAIESFHSLLADIEASRYGLSQDAGPSAAIWRAARDLSDNQQIFLIAIGCGYFHPSMFI